MGACASAAQTSSQVPHRQPDHYEKARPLGAPWEPLALPCHTGEPPLAAIGAALIERASARLCEAMEEGGAAAAEEDHDMAADPTDPSALAQELWELLDGDSGLAWCPFCYCNIPTRKQLFSEHWDHLANHGECLGGCRSHEIIDIIVIVMLQTSVRSGVSSALDCMLSWQTPCCQLYSSNLP
jgi:hypothetical protein